MTPQGTLSEADLAPTWWQGFGLWQAEATGSGLFVEPTAAVLSTVSVAGPHGAVPHSRSVLVKEVDERGFVFYTNRRSRKAADLAEVPRAALTFPWYALARQVNVTGSVVPVDDADSDAYFATRPRGAQIGAWASEQSAVVSDRRVLEEKVAEVAARFAGADVPRPPHWGGYRLEPDAVEMWQGQPDRLHDRLRYRRDGGRWVIERLSP